MILTVDEGAVSKVFKNDARSASYVGATFRNTILKWRSSNHFRFECNAASTEQNTYQIINNVGFLSAAI